MYFYFNTFKKISGIVRRLGWMPMQWGFLQITNRPADGRLHESSVCTQKCDEAISGPEHADADLGSSNRWRRTIRHAIQNWVRCVFVTRDFLSVVTELSVECDAVPPSAWQHLHHSSLCREWRVQLVPWDRQLCGSRCLNGIRRAVHCFQSDDLRQEAASGSSIIRTTNSGSCLFLEIDQEHSNIEESWRNVVTIVWNGISVKM